MGLFICCMLYWWTSFHTICININILMKQRLSLLPPLSHNINHFHSSGINGNAFGKHFTSFRQLFKKLEILPLYTRSTYFLYYCLWWRTGVYIQLTKKFMTLIQDKIQICIFQWSIWLHFKGDLIFFGIKLFNHLPTSIKNLPNETIQTWFKQNRFYQ